MPPRRRRKPRQANPENGNQVSFDVAPAADSVQEPTLLDPPPVPAHQAQPSLQLPPPSEREGTNRKNPGKARTLMGINDTHRSHLNVNTKSVPDLANYQSVGREQDIWSQGNKNAHPASTSLSKPATPSAHAATVSYPSNSNRGTTPNNQNKAGESASNPIEVMSGVRYQNKTLEEAQPSRKTKKEHTQFWAEFAAADTLRSLVLNKNKEDYRKLKEMNKQIIVMNKQNKWQADLGTLPLDTYMGHLNLLKPIYKNLQQHPQDPEAWNQWKGTKRITITSM